MIAGLELEQIELNTIVALGMKSFFENPHVRQLLDADLSLARSFYQRCGTTVFQRAVLELLSLTADGLLW
jgi:hypothetical protein